MRFLLKEGKDAFRGAGGFCLLGRRIGRFLGILETNEIDQHFIGTVQKIHNTRDTFAGAITICFCLRFSLVLPAADAAGLSGVSEANTKLLPVRAVCTGKTDLVKDAMVDKSLSLRRRKDPLLTC